MRFLTAKRQLPSSLQAGFTLIELLVVLVILGLLAGLVGPQVLSYVGSSKTKDARLQIEQLRTALDLYRIDVGDYPTTAQGLQALLRAPAAIVGWNGPYLNKPVVPADPWGRPFNYRSPGEHGQFDLFTLGRDGRGEGTGENAAVTSWQ